MLLLLLSLLPPPAPPTPTLRQLADAVLRAPYQPAPREALAAYAQAHGLRFAPPPIHLPVQPHGNQDSGITINIDGNKAQDPLTPVYFAYSLNAAVWRQGRFHQRFPREAAYRDSLPEERDGIGALLATVRQQHIPAAQLDPTLKKLQALKRDGMLSCWILLDESTPDRPAPGPAQDYASYRAKHRALLRAYLLRYDVHPA